ncbi:MAG: TetR/AcrR family transcriptional regulator [Pseudomonadales bacterium]
MDEGSRPTKKREQTRRKLIAAARELVYQRGHEKIAIQDITAQANVGLGTFYNYFDTKQAVFEAVLDDIRQTFNKRLDELRAPLKDPALIVAVTHKYCFQQAQDNEEWNTFLTYSGLGGEYTLGQDEDQCLADIKRGVNAGRFKVEDVFFAQSLVIGMVQHVNREIARGRLSRQAMEEATRYILRMLGLPDLVAKALVQTPIPAMAAPRRDALAGAGILPTGTTPIH